jgi:hypothetical protein
MTVPMTSFAMFIPSLLASRLILNNSKPADVHNGTRLQDQIRNHSPILLQQMLHVDLPPSGATQVPHFGLKLS